LVLQILLLRLPSFLVLSIPIGTLLGSLIAVGRLGTDDLLSCAVLLPGALLGFAGSRWLAGHLDRTTARPVVLALSSAAAVAVIVKTVW